MEPSGSPGRAGQSEGTGHPAPSLLHKCEMPETVRENEARRHWD